MKLLRIENSLGFFLAASGEHMPIDGINKEELLRLVNLTLSDEQVEFDPYDESMLKNQAHRVIYKNVCQKLLDLRSRKKEFLDGSARLFLEDYERYRSGTAL